MKLVIVDCENESIKALNNLFEAKDTNVCLVFGQRNDKKYNKYKDKAIVVKSKLAGKNAADFVLVAALTKLMLEGDYSKATIISNDHGFDSAVEYLKSIGFRVSRESTFKETKPNDLQAIGIKNKQSTIYNFCGYLARRIKSGESLSKAKKKLDGCYEATGVELIHDLEKLGIIKMRNKSRQLYFSKKILVTLSREKPSNILNWRNEHGNK